MEARLVEQIVSILINYILLVINFLYVRIIMYMMNILKRTMLNKQVS